MKKSTIQRGLAMLLAAGCCAALVQPAAAQGRGSFSLGINIGGPIYRPYPYRPFYGPAYYRPYPLYIAPPPVLVRPAPVYLESAPVVVQPAPVVVPTVPVPTYPAPAPTPTIPPSGGGVQPAGPAYAAHTEDTIERHLQLLTSADERVRSDAVMDLGRMRAERATDRLAAVLAGDRSPTVRDSAARALGLIGERRALPALQHAAQADSDRDVRRSAQFAVEIITTNLRK